LILTADRVFGLAHFIQGLLREIHLAPKSSPLPASNAI